MTKVREESFKNKETELLKVQEGLKDLWKTNDRWYEKYFKQRQKKSHGKMLYDIGQVKRDWKQQQQVVKKRGKSVVQRGSKDKENLFTVRKYYRGGRV